MRLETFGYLPPFTAEEQTAQIASLLERGLIPAVEYAEDPTPRNRYWHLWRLPLFEARSAEDVLAEVDACAAANPDAYVKLIGYDPTTQGQTAFVVRRPASGAA